MTPEQYALREHARKLRWQLRHGLAGVRDANRASQQRHRAEQHIEKVNRPFIGVDGEGGNLNGRHEYLLLTAGDKHLHTGEPLRAIECLDFLANLPEKKIYVAYYFDYDVTMMIRGLPDERVRRLLARDSRLSQDRKFTYPLDYGPFQLDYIPRKEFKVRTKGKPWRIISDVGSFFQCSFLKAITDWEIGTPEQRAMIAEGKAGRATFTKLTAETLHYNDLEIELLQTLMNTFRAVCADIGYIPDKWQGPGWGAVSMMQRHNVPRTREITIPEPVITAANESFYGGRFETTAIGPVNGPIYQYDINSAYPWALLQLPCLRCARWEQRKPKECELWLGYGAFSAFDPATLYCYPLRTKTGTIIFPTRGRGWYWGVESSRASHQTFNPETCYVLQSTCQHKTFSYMEAVYAERIKLGKTSKGRVLKLFMNSHYGKAAQSVGAAPYANPVYASLITALTRAKLYEALHPAGWCYCNDTLMLATDGIFTTRPLPHLPLTNKLGEWECVEHPEIFIIQPGLYLLGDASPKTRGLPRQAVVTQETDFRAAYNTLIKTDRLDPVKVSLTNFIGLRQAYHRNKPELAGTWQNLVKEIGLDWSTKRDTNNVWWHGDVMRTQPKDIPGYPKTVPYTKIIGKMLGEQKLELLDQPDWADLLIGD